MIAVYWLWIRPILKSRPAFRDLDPKQTNFFAAVGEKFSGIKQKLSTAVVIAASVAVSGYDLFAPIVNGVDVTPLTSQVPSWAWPLVLIATTALLQFCRNLADKRHQAELAKAAPIDAQEPGSDFEAHRLACRKVHAVKREASELMLDGTSIMTPEMRHMRASSTAIAPREPHSPA
jgi:hypothetical protein